MDHSNEFIGALPFTGPQALCDAALHMILQQKHRDGVRRCLHRGDLLEDVHAVPVFFDHAGEAACLSFDAAQPREKDVLTGCVGRRFIHCNFEYRGGEYTYKGPFGPLAQCFRVVAYDLGVVVIDRSEEHER